MAYFVAAGTRMGRRARDRIGKGVSDNVQVWLQNLVRVGKVKVPVPYYLLLQLRTDILPTYYRISHGSFVHKIFGLDLCGAYLVGTFNTLYGAKMETLSLHKTQRRAWCCKTAI